MKIMKKFTLFLLCGAFVLSCVSCKKKDDDNNTVISSDSVIHYVEGTLHKVNVSESNVPFVKNGQTEYKIYADASNESLKSAVTKSANFVSEQVANATGAELEVVFEKPVGLTENTYAIVYGYRDLFEGLGLKMPTDDIARSGYHIKTKGNVVFIQANGSDGYRMGGLAFLRETLGYDMLSEECIVYSRDASTMPSMDITEKPDFDYRMIQNAHSSIETYGMGMHDNSDIWIPVNGWDMHNTLYYVPWETWGEIWPEWYRSDLAQVCYTAHGNQDAYEALLQAVFEVIKKRMQECPTIENISFSAMDGTGEDSCACETCSEYEALYGTPASTCIYFMNDLNEMVQTYINEYEPGRLLNLVFFAYHDAEPAPVERTKYTDANGNVIWGEPIADENGEYTPLKRYARDEKGRFVKDESGNYVYETDENGNYVYLRCDEHVYPWLAPIYAKFTTSFYDEENATYARNLEAWNEVSDNIYVWIYGINFKYYLYPYNTWSTMVETYRYMKENRVSYLWTQADKRTKNTAFGHLKDYIDSKFKFDVNADYGKVLDSYFDNYYLEASDSMRAMFDLVQAQSAYLETTQPTITGGIYDEIGNAEYWPRLLVEELLSMIDDAYAAVEKYKYSDPTLYESLLKRIKTESIFPRYVQCMYYGDYYADIRERREAFRDDWNALGFSLYKEADGDMQSVFTNDWGL